MASNVTRSVKAQPPKMETTVIDESDLIYHQPPIGRGATGEVFKVTWKSMGITAAAKKITLFRDEDKNRHIKEKFESEVNYLRTMNHENIITFYGQVVTSDYLVIVTEYAANGSLSDYLRKCKDPIPLKQKLEWAIQAAKAIGHLRENKVLHRDIKPGNFVITSDNILKLCDFDISKELTSTKNATSGKGTLRWQAPELWVGKTPQVSPKADIFAFGIMLWQLETREITPYKDLTEPQVIFQVGNDGLRPRIPHDCDTFLKSLMQQCWHEDRKERPDVEKILERLQFYLSSIQTSQLRMVIIGMTGEGKSATGNSILMDPRAFKSTLGLQSVTSKCEIQIRNVFGTDILIVDTPGLFDTYGTSNSKLIIEIIRCLYMSAPGPHAVLLTIAIGRLSPETQRGIQLFCACFGEQVKNYMIVVFTHADDLLQDHISIEEVVEHGPSSFQKLLQQCGKRYVSFNNRCAPRSNDNNAQVKYLLDMVQDMMAQNGGGYYTSELLQNVETKRKDIEENIRRNIARLQNNEDGETERDPEYESRQTFQEKSIL